MTPHNRRAGAGCKPPQAAGVKSFGRERCGKGIIKVSGVNQRRRTQVNHRSSVESTQTTSKLKSDVASGSVRREPVYWPDGVRHRGGVILVRALTLNCGNLRWRCQGKGTSVKSKADSTEAPSRGGVICSSDEGLVMRLERRDHVIHVKRNVNCENRRNVSG